MKYKLSIKVFRETPRGTKASWIYIGQYDSREKAKEYAEWRKRGDSKVIDYKIVEVQ